MIQVLFSGENYSYQKKEQSLEGLWQIERVNKSGIARKYAYLIEDRLQCESLPEHTHITTCSNGTVVFGKFLNVQPHSPEQSYLSQRELLTFNFDVKGELIRILFSKELPVAQSISINQNSSWIAVNGNASMYVGQSYNKVKQINSKLESNKYSNFNYLVLLDRDEIIVEVAQCLPPPKFTILDCELIFFPCKQGIEIEVLTEDGWNIFKSNIPHFIPNITAVRLRSKTHFGLPKYLIKKSGVSWQLLFDAFEEINGKRLHYPSGSLVTFPLVINSNKVL